MRRYIWGLILTAFFGFFCGYGIDAPPAPYFDETHYVPAAKAYLAGNHSVNREHPPLGKTIIGRGISIFGDNPMGWRVMSLLFGMLTLFGIYTWALVLFGSVSAALMAATLTAANQLLYVQSRIAMLDTIMVGFLVWSCVCLTYWLRDKTSRRVLVLSGLFMAFAVATKWFALVPLAGICGYLLFHCRDRKALVDLAVFLGAFGFFYFICFPWSDFWGWQSDIWNGQRNVPRFHPYASAWWSWPLQIRPMWYFYEPGQRRETARAVFLIGNPVILCGGLVALLMCLWRAWKGSFSARILVYAFGVSLLCWPFIPRGLTLFYYYYPATCLMGLILTEALKMFSRVRWLVVVAALGVFIYFLPVLNASEQSVYKIQNRQWFRSWI